MKNKTLWRTNLLVCVIIVIGFIVTSVISYHSNFGIYKKDIEQVSTLTSEGIYNQIDDIFTRPVNVSLTMANDSLLKTFLSDEEEKLNDREYEQEMKGYLNAYKEKYNYDSVFLVSAKTGRYYHFNGIDRVLLKGDPENTWYYDFLEDDEEYSLNVDNDQAATDTITVFVNCKIKDNDGHVMGVVGVGLQVHSLQALLKSYEQKYDVTVSLIDQKGMVEISSERTGYEKTDFFEGARYPGHKKHILNNRETRQAFWYNDHADSGFVVVRYEPNFRWHLIVENDTSLVNARMSKQFWQGFLIIGLIILLVLYTITTVIRKYNDQIIKLTVSQEMEYQQLLHEATEGLYENIFEFDLTRNRAASESTKEYFRSLGLSGEASYDEALHQLSHTQLKEEYRQGYLELFLSREILRAYREGITNLSYDFMMAQDGEAYRWMRISARIFFWNSDQSIRMIAYRKSIDEEKRQEFRLLEGIQRDSMTGLYNKRATEELVGKALEEKLDEGAIHGFLMFDLDDFKLVNDTMGHQFGDHVIEELAAELKAQFREQDIVGRIGGDEFAVFMRNVESLPILQQKLERLCERLSSKDVGEGSTYHTSCSIGVSLFPKDGTTYAQLCEKADQALYYAKGHGKSTFAIYGVTSDNQPSHISARDMETMLHAVTDGVTKFACTKPMKLLYFNQKFAELMEVPIKKLAVVDCDMLLRVHPDDRWMVPSLEEMATKRETSCYRLRIKGYDERYRRVQVRTIFTGELYDNQYPVFYVLYNKEER